MLPERQQQQQQKRNNLGGWPDHGATKSHVLQRARRSSPRVRGFGRPAGFKHFLLHQTLYHILIFLFRRKTILVTKLPNAKEYALLTQINQFMTIRTALPSIRSRYGSCCCCWRRRGQRYRNRRNAPPKNDMHTKID